MTFGLTGNRDIPFKKGNNGEGNGRVSGQFSEGPGI